MEYLKDFYDNACRKYFYNFSTESYDINKIITNLVIKVDLTYSINFDNFNYNDYYEI